MPKRTIELTPKEMRRQLARTEKLAKKMKEEAEAEMERMEEEEEDWDAQFNISPLKGRRDYCRTER